ncbi:MAG TPA: site-specific DNA-methyltransferase, partial [Vicinamibacterales bacterium]|nr:site-specific DNA-methyltransferase [Vicinamibacterales bacterium]
GQEVSVTPYWQSPDGRHTIYHGKCEQIMPQLAGPFDAVIADLPYGTTACAWDVIIPFDVLWEQYRRLVKRNGAVVLFGSQPFTSALVMSNPKWFRYEWVWEKQKTTEFLNARRRPLKSHENVVVFSRAATRYFPQGVIPGKPNSGAERSRRGRLYSGGHPREGYIGKEVNFPRSVLRFDAPTNNQLHPTQKPEALLEYLVRTYTNEGEIVLDNTAGSMTTGVACIRTGRRSVLIELEERYCAIGAKRMEKALDAYQEPLPLDVPAAKPVTTQPALLEA